MWKMKSAVLVTIISLLGAVNGVGAKERVSAGKIRRHRVCIAKDGYFPVPNQCDAYYQCKGWKATKVYCPDGLRFNPAAAYDTFPCVYPYEVSCENRIKLQTPNPTADCPHLYGFFVKEGSTDCGAYKSCVNGVAYDFHCPQGLAYNIETYQCQWPDLVKTCNVEDYLGFSCPGIFDEESSSRALPMNYSHPSDCKKYYACISGKPRLLSCGAKEVFNEVSGRCESNEVAFCVLDEAK